MAIGLAAASLAGCDAGSETEVGPHGELTVRLDEFKIDPQTIVAGSGDLRVTVINQGVVAHNWRVFNEPRKTAEAQQEDVVEESEDDSDRGTLVGGATTMVPRDEQVAELNLKPGRYRIFCTVGNHARLGMAGELVVKRRRS